MYLLQLYSPVFQKVNNFFHVIIGPLMSSEGVRKKKQKKKIVYFSRHNFQTNKSSLVKNKHSKTIKLNSNAQFLVFTKFAVWFF